jgi:SAM-dependent methyltransferase
MDYIKTNSDMWDKFVENENTWTLPVSTEDIENARNGKWEIVLTPIKPVPKNWFPTELADKKVLLIACGGGQQGPILAALGADVTVFDNSRKQLEQDEFVAKRDKLKITTVQGNMQDLSVFCDETFDFIMQIAGCFVDSVLPVWKEAYRVLKKGGTMLAGHNHPLEFIFDVGAMEKGELIPRYKIPYADTDYSEGEEYERAVEGGVCFGHTHEDMIQGQIDAGFLIAGYYGDSGCGYILDNYIDTFFATKAIKL